MKLAQSLADQVGLMPSLDELPTAGPQAARADYGDGEDRE